MTRTPWILLLTYSAALAAGPAKDSVPLFFVANNGQAPEAVRFMAKGSGITAFFSPGEVLLRHAGTSIHMRFEGAMPGAEVRGLDPLAGRANFLTGTVDRWHTGVPLFGRVAYRSLYPGIDMIYGADGRNLKSEYVVAPGADPSRISVRYLGAGTPQIAADGALLIPVNGHPLREEAPYVYQIRGGKRVEVAGRFALADDGAVGFQ